MRNKFDEYWVKCSLGLAVASMLDPRFKNLSFHKMSRMARNVLGFPMSKVPPELAFNNCGRVLDFDWSSLNPATVQALVCSQDWIRSELES